MKKRLVDLKGVLVKSDYNGDFVDSQCSRMTESRGSELLCIDRKRSRDKNEKIVLVLYYHPALLKIHRILRELHVLAEWSPTILL